MILYPRAKYMPIREASTQAHMNPIGVLLHTAVGAGSLYRYFGKDSVREESNLWIGKVEGEVEAYLPIDVRADAAWAANGIYAMVETADNGRPATDPWTDFQLEELAQFIAWGHARFGWPIRLCRYPGDSGIGHHQQFRAWNENGHNCPGPTRRAQIAGILRRATELATIPTEEDFMAHLSPEASADIAELIENAFSKRQVIDLGNPAQDFSRDQALSYAGRSAAGAAKAAISAAAAAAAAAQKGEPLTLEETRAAVEAGVKAVLLDGVTS